MGCEKTCLDIRGITLIYIVYCLQKQLTISGRGWAKYRDLSVASRSIICRSRRLRQIIDLRDTGKSRYFVIIEFNNSFIIWSPSLFFNEYLWEAKRSAFFHARTYHVWFRLRMSRILFAASTQLDDIAHEQTIICRQLFAGHVVGFQPMKRKKNLHWNYCPRRDFDQKAKSRGGTLATRAYIKESTYSWNIQS